MNNPAPLPTDVAWLPSSARREGTRYDLVPHVAIKRMAKRFADYISRWGNVPVQDKKWSGDDKRKAINHLIEHALQYKEHGDDTADNLGAILANAAILAVIDDQASDAVLNVNQRYGRFTVYADGRISMRGALSIDENDLDDVACAQAAAREIKKSKR